MKTIYCVDDDESIRGLIVYAVKSSGFEAEGFSDGAAFERDVSEKLPDLILLDIMLPDKDGIEILTELRSNRLTKHIPVIMLTAKDEECDKVKGFEAGADDYVTKPFSVLELISRIKAVLRRSNIIDDDILSVDGIEINRSKRTVTVDGQPVNVTYKEFELLQYLMRHKDTPVSRETLLNKIWGYHFEGESRTLDVHIGSLRHKLGDKGRLIETIRNVGYKI